MPSHSTNETDPVELAEIRASLVKFARNVAALGLGADAGTHQ